MSGSTSGSAPTSGAIAPKRPKFDGPGPEAQNRQHFAADLYARHRQTLVTGAVPSFRGRHTSDLFFFDTYDHTNDTLRHLVVGVKAFPHWSMTVAASKASAPAAPGLPGFKNPPVSEVALSLQFDPLPGLQIHHFGLLWTEF